MRRAGTPTVSIDPMWVCVLELRPGVSADAATQASERAEAAQRYYEALALRPGTGPLSVSFDVLEHLANDLRDRAESDFGDMLECKVAQDGYRVHLRPDPNLENTLAES